MKVVKGIITVEDPYSFEYEEIKYNKETYYISRYDDIVTLYDENYNEILNTSVTVNEQTEIQIEVYKNMDITKEFVILINYFQL